MFHLPRRSHFVFVNLLKQFKGSDASNVHDEEPGEDEIEFSDDEAEAAYRSRLKHKRGRERSMSASSSRHSTPVPSQMRDQDMMTESVLNKSAFDEHGPYDLDYGAGPSRPTPKPYDDPYSITFSTSNPEGSTTDSRMGERSERPVTSKDGNHFHSSQARVRGRGRGRGKRITSHSQSAFARDGSHRHFTSAASPRIDTYDPRSPQESFPTPFMRAQGNQAFTFTPSGNAGSTWGYPEPSFGQSQNQQSYMFPGQSYQASYVPPSTFVQPHINPRFASAFGFQLGPSTTSSTTNLSAIGATPQDWMEQWTAPSTDVSEPKPEQPGT